MRILTFAFLLFLPIAVIGQQEITSIEEINLDKIENHTINKYWLKMIEDGMSHPIYIPVIIVKGKTKSPVLGLTAAIHGNELNGIKVIHEVVENIDVSNLKGTVIAIPGLNQISLTQHKRRYVDEEDLNRNFPGKEKGNRSQQYVWQINQKIISQLEYLVDMHTASFGRENSLYVRADLNIPKIEKMAMLQDADIILNNKGIPSVNEQVAATRTMRAEAMLKGIPTITIEYGNPQVFQQEMISRGKRGVENIMSWLGMTEIDLHPIPEPILCYKSYWIYMEEGGYLELTVDLNQKINKGDIIGIVRSPFGNILKTYYSPEDGVVIGRSSNPVNMSGGRIIHLGIIQE